MSLDKVETPASPNDPVGRPRYSRREIGSWRSGPRDVFPTTRALRDIKRDGDGNNQATDEAPRRGRRVGVSRRSHEIGGRRLRSRRYRCACVPPGTRGSRMSLSHKLHSAISCNECLGQITKLQGSSPPTLSANPSASWVTAASRHASAASST
jgi:hypothetical protein